MNQQLREELLLLAQTGDQTGRFTHQQLEIIYQEKWFKIFVPKRFGGLELDLIEGLELEENLARIDGSLGWTVTLCSGASQFIGYLAPSVREAIFHDTKLCIGGSGSISGIARCCPNGYVVNGFWKYATGSAYATHFTANCQLEKDGQLLTDPITQQPVYQSFLFYRHEVQVHKDWDPMGLKATASDSFEVSEQFVPFERAFNIDPEKVQLDDPIFKYPFQQFAEATLAVNTFGLSQGFLEHFHQIIIQKSATGNFNFEQYELMKSRLHMAQSHLQKLRVRFYATLDQSWNYMVNKHPIPEDLLNQVTYLSKGLTKSAREMVGDLYPYCGVRATQTHSVINRIFRDIFTASQHLLLNL